MMHTPASDLYLHSNCTILFPLLQRFLLSSAVKTAVIIQTRVSETAMAEAERLRTNQHVLLRSFTDDHDLENSRAMHTLDAVQFNITRG
jgi:hypothetical protein